MSNKVGAMSMLAISSVRSVSESNCPAGQWTIAGSLLGNVLRSLLSNPSGVR